MGNDGGSIPHRAEVVKQKKKEERKDQFEMARAKSRLCAISKNPLREPIAVCKLGLLYNKEEIIKRLIEKEVPRAFRHIKKLKDVKEVKCQTRVDPKDDDYIVLVCPVSQTEFNGFNAFSVSWPCGCAFSDEAMQELKSNEKCLNCGIEIKKEDIISLNQTADQQLDYLVAFDEKERLEKEERDKKKKAKKNNKRSNKDRENGSDQEEIKKEENSDGIDANKRQKTDQNKKPEEKSEVFKSLFHKQFEENKDMDFLCRNVKYGLH
eukprot:403366309